MNLVGMKRTGSGEHAGLRASSHSTACVRRNSPASGKSPRPRTVAFASSEKEFVRGRVPSKAGRAGAVEIRESSPSSADALSWGGMNLWTRTGTSGPDFTEPFARLLFHSLFSVCIHVLGIFHALL